MQTYGDVYLSMTLHLPIKMTPVVFDLAQGWLESRHFIRSLKNMFSNESRLGAKCGRCSTLRTDCGNWKTLLCPVQKQLCGWGGPVCEVPPVLFHKVVNRALQPLLSVPEEPGELLVHLFLQSILYCISCSILLGHRKLFIKSFLCHNKIEPFMPEQDRAQHKVQERLREVSAERRGGAA